MIQANRGMKNGEPYSPIRRGNLSGMSWSKVLVMALSGALLAGQAFAQDDDDELMDLGPSKKKDPKAKPKPKPKPAVKPAPKPSAASDDELAPLTPAKGELVLKLAAGTTLKKAKVTIDDKDVGTFPVPSQSVSTGEHVIVIRAQGHATWTKKVNVGAGKPTEVIANPEANAAIVSITTDTNGAQVSINGKVLGTAPIEELEVAPGAATITVHKDGYKDLTQTLKLVAGKEYPISVKLGAPIPATEAVAAAPTTDRPENTNLVPAASEDVGVSTRVEPSSPIYTRWYFWAGAVAVVAAVAVGSAVGVSAGTPKRLGEKDICGPTGCDACIGGFMCGASAAGAGIAPFKF
jgi:hypothetical protein